MPSLPHVHLLITGGGITPDGQHWQSARGEFLVPVAQLSRKVAALVNYPRQGGASRPEMA